MAPRSKRDKNEEREPEPADNGHAANGASYEEELEDLLNERIKPGLNRGAIPLLARSLAREIAQREIDEYDDEGRSDDESSSADLETDLHELQARLGDDWILYFSVQGENSWLTAEKQDASQRLEAPTASVLVKAVKLLNEGGGRTRT